MMNEYPHFDSLTEQERLYFDCKTEAPSGKQSAAAITKNMLASFFSMLFRAVLAQTSAPSKADRRLFEAIKLKRYAKFKAAVLRKAAGTRRKGDEKLLKKLNKAPFVLSEETYDPDEYTRQLYEEYMEKHS